MQSMHKPSGEPAVPMPVMVAADLQDALLVAMRDLRKSDVNNLTLGQYLRHTEINLTVAMLYSPS